MRYRLAAALVGCLLFSFGWASAQGLPGNITGTVINITGNIPPPPGHHHTAPAPLLAAGLPAFAAVGGGALIGLLRRRKRQ